MKNLYLPFSQYHLFLTFALSAEHSGDDNVVVLGDSDDEMISAFELLSALFPEVKIHFVKLLASNTKNNLVNFMNKKKNLRAIENVLKSNDFDRFYYFCEWSVYTAFASHLLRNKRCALYFCEDGMATYTEPYLRGKNFLEERADKLIYGSWHKSVKVPGGLNDDASFALIFPDFAHEAYGKREKVRISNDRLIEKISKTKVDEIKRESGGAEFNEIIATDHDSYTDTDKYRELIRSEIEKGLASASPVALKRHPRDENEYMKPNAQVTVLPNRYPIEIYYAVYRSSLKKVVGSLSTSLITARWFMKDAEIVSLLAKENLSQTENLDEKTQLLQRLNISFGVV